MVGTRPSGPRFLFGWRGAGWIALMALRAAAQPDEPLCFEDVPRLARAGRAEVVAAAERATAAEQRPRIVSALDDPMVFPSVDHWPFGMPAADLSLTIEQRFPLSGLLGHRRRAAVAEGHRQRSEAQRVVLEVQLDAVGAFLMVYERRAMLRILDGQRGLAEQLVAASAARAATSTGAQAELVRAELEAARIDAALVTLRAQVQASERMLNASLGRAATAPVPPLTFAARTAEAPEATQAVDVALAQRPELAAGRAEVARAEAEIAAMRAMYFPMAMVRAGPAYTMTDGFGAMLMVGVSVPLFRGKLEAGVLEAEAMSRMAKADLEAMRRMSAGQSAAARDEVVAARAQFVALRDEVLPRAERAIAPAVAGYAAGQLPLVSVLDAARALWAAQEQVLEAEVTLGAAWARLGRATGDVEGVFRVAR